MTGAKLIRAMKARRSGLLACGHYVLAGALIVKTTGCDWICKECRLAELDSIRQTMTEPPRPSSRGDTRSPDEGKDAP